MIRVAVVDDQPLIRSALSALLERADDVTVVGEAGDGWSALELVARLRPDVVLMDVRMPGLDGLRATARLRDDHPDVRVIVLTTYHLDSYVVDAIQAGASGFFLKDGDADDLVRGVRAVHSGEVLMSPAALRTLFEAFVALPRPDPEAANRVAGLTDRERDVLRLMAEGDANADIAAALFLGVATVKTHVSNVLAKLGVRDRTQAVVIAYRSGLMAPGG